MMEIGIFDQEFAHHGFSSLIEPKYLKWSWNDPSKDIIFFTDRELEQARNIQGVKKIAWLIEPRAFHNEAYEFITANFDNFELFDYIITHDTKILEMSRKCLFCNASATTWIPEEDQKIHNKSKLVSIISSGKNQTEGHILRNEAVLRLGSKMDCYGPQCSALMPLTGKSAALRDYYFSVVILNSKYDCYYTEALIDAFMTGTIPIFWGTDRIREFFCTEGILSFDSINELESILDRISPELYESKREFIQMNYEWASQYKAPEDWLFERYSRIFTNE